MSDRRCSMGERTSGLFFVAVSVSDEAVRSSRVENSVVVDRSAFRARNAFVETGVVSALSDTSRP